MENSNLIVTNVSSKQEKLNPGKKVRLVTFNICGIKGILSNCAQWNPDKTFASLFDYLEADIVCFQETKIQSLDIAREMVIVPGFTAYFTCSTVKKGYSGVVIYVKNSIRVFSAEEGLTGWLPAGANRKPYREQPDSLPVSIYPAIPEPKGRSIDEQGRSLTLDLGCCVIIGVYSPANSQGNMEEYRENFFELLDCRVRELKALGRVVVVLGDMNVAREPRDSAPLRDELLQEHVTIDRDVWMHGDIPHAAVNGWIEELGFMDTSRLFHPERENMFTCWDQRRQCRPANYGSRIDLIMADPSIECLEADIMPQLVGSDHCPVYADLMLSVEPQAANRLPYLAKKLLGRWSQSLSDFFPRKQIKKEATPPKSATVIGKVTKVRKPKPAATVSSMFAAKSQEWSNMAELQPPLCNHKEPCILNKCTKKGKHQGRYYWTCSRPDSGKLNPTNEFRCRTYIWDSERSKRAENGHRSG